MAYGSSQARGIIGATAAGLHHSHSNRSRVLATSMTYTTAHGNARSLTHDGRPGIKPASSWILVSFFTPEPWWELPGISLDAGFSTMTIMFQQPQGRILASEGKLKWLQLTPRGWAMLLWESLRKEECQWGAFSSWEKKSESGSWGRRWMAWEEHQEQPHPKW